LVLWMTHSVPSPVPAPLVTDPRPVCVVPATEPPKTSLTHAGPVRILLYPAHALVSMAIESISLQIASLKVAPPPPLAAAAAASVGPASSSSIPEQSSLNVNALEFTPAVAVTLSSVPQQQQQQRSASPSKTASAPVENNRSASALSSLRGSSPSSSSSSVSSSLSSSEQCLGFPASRQRGCGGRPADKDHYIFYQAMCGQQVGIIKEREGETQRERDRETLRRIAAAMEVTQMAGGKDAREPPSCGDRTEREKQQRERGHREREMIVSTLNMG